MLKSLLNQRYLFEQELGQGGMGVVYRAHDSLLDRKVAIKVLATASMGTEGRTRLLREAQSAARLNHPNIVSVYDAGETDDTSYIIMELLQGQSLSEKKDLSLTALLPILGQICDALGHAHQNNIIHRDLKPENVILTDQGVVKLTDFGLARSAASRLTLEGTLVGTVFYMAPEQAMGGVIDGRTDLYAMGAMLYELVTGRLPFFANDPLSVVSQHLYAPVVPPSNYNQNIPPVLDELIIRLMSKRPDDRPRSADEVRHILDMLASQLEGGTVQPVAHAPLDRLGLAILVGRDDELVQAKGMWSSAATGVNGHRILLVSGESGVGKTPFVKEVQAFAAITGGKVIQTQCYAEGSAPYAPIAQIIRTALGVRGTPPPEGRKTLDLPPQILADLITIAPDLRLVYPEIPPNPSLEPQAEQGRLFESVVSLCIQLSAGQPLLLVIEDIQWGDGGSIFLLRHLARRARTAQLPILILMTYREAEIDESAILGSVLLDLQHEHLAMRIKLTRLDRQGTQLALEAILKDAVAPALVDAVYRETEGNLFFIEELVRSLVENEAIACTNRIWDRTQPGGLELPQSVRATIQARLGKLPETAQETLHLAAVIGHEFDFATLSKASDVGEDALIQALELAVHARIIHEVRGKGPETFAFTHGLFPATLRDSLSSLRRHRLHRRVASAIAAMRPDDYASLAFHARAAGDQEGARKYYLKAADRAAKVHANADAVRFLSEVLETSELSAEERFELLNKRWSQNGFMGQRDAQMVDVEAMLALAEQLDDDALRSTALLSQARVYMEVNSLQALEPAEKALEIANHLGDLQRQGECLTWVGWVHRMLGDYSQSRKMLAESIKCYRQVGSLALAARSMHTLGLVLGELGDMDASLQASQEALEMSRQAGDQSQEAHALRRLAIVHMNRNMNKEALPFAEEALRLHRIMVDREGEVAALNVLGILNTYLGKITQAEESLRASLELAISINSSMGINYAAINLVDMLPKVTGESEAALLFLDDLLHRFAGSQDEILISSFENSRANLLASLGQQVQALQILEKLHSEPATQSSRISRIINYAHRSRIHAELGDFRAAQDLLEDADQMIKAEEFAPSKRAAILVNQVYIFYLQGSQKSYEKALETAILLESDLQDPESLFDRIALLSLAALSAVELNLFDQAVQLSTEAVNLTVDVVFPAAYAHFAQARVMAAIGRLEESHAALQRAYNLVKNQLDHTQNPVYKRTLVENVPLNLAIVQAYQEQLPG